MRGTASDGDGAFSFGPLAEGAHRLVVSMIGYETWSESFYLTADQSAEQNEIDARLSPAPIELGEIAVTAERDRGWRKLLTRFETLLLGETEAAQSAEITNPEVLDFERRWHGRFTASSERPIAIRNEALGYEVDYVLTSFEESGGYLRYDGEPLFRELVPEGAEQAAQWEANRTRAFNGSLRHFLLALLAGRTEEEGFSLYAMHSRGDRPDENTRRRMDPSGLLRQDPETGGTMLRFDGFLEVTYSRELETEAFRVWQNKWPYHHAEYQQSYLRLADGPTLVDPRGEVLDPYGLILYGYFAFERIADEVPREYRPSDFALASE
jgi:hypothetical protein